MFSFLKKPAPVNLFKDEMANSAFRLQTKKRLSLFRSANSKPWKDSVHEISPHNFWIYLPIGLFMILALYGFWAEPYWIQVNRFHLQIGINPPLKIAHLTDLHTYGLGSREQEVLNRLEEEKPDLIAITGDTLSQSGTYELCRPFLSKLHAPSGIWAVPGNFENRRKLENEPAFYSSLNIHYLVNPMDRLQFIRW